VLHIVNKSPYSKDSLGSCIRVAAKGDPILLIEDAVVGVLATGKMADTIKAAQKDHEVYALIADIKARGIDRVVDGVKEIDYLGFVALVEQHRPMSWL